MSTKVIDKRQSLIGRALLARGAAFAALCCVALFILAGLVTTLGLGFILKDSILMGLLIIPRSCGDRLLPHASAEACVIPQYSEGRSNARAI